RHERNAVPRTRPHDRLHLLDALRQDDKRRDDAVARQAVAFVGAELLRLGDDGAVREPGADLLLERARQRHECKATSVATKTDIALIVPVPAGGEGILTDGALDF